MTSSSLCSPALLYLIISILAIIMMIVRRMQAMTIVTKALFVVIWTWFLNFLCSKNYTDISWFLVILPMVLMLVIFSLAYETVLINKLKRDLRREIRNK